MAIFQTPDGRFFNIPKERADDVAGLLAEYEMSAEAIEAEINKTKQAPAAAPAPAQASQGGGTTIINIYCGGGAPAVQHAQQGDVEGYSFHDRRGQWGEPGDPGGLYIRNFGPGPGTGPTFPEPPEPLF